MPSRWTPDLVLAAEIMMFLRLPALHAFPPGRLIPALEGDSFAAFALLLTEIGREALGPDSLERIALLTRARARAGGPSISLICRERHGWHRSRQALWRQSCKACRILADVLNQKGVPVPRELRS